MELLFFEPKQEDSMNKKDLVEKIAQEAGVTKVLATKCVDSIIGNIMDAMGKGDGIQLIGFGTFQPVKRAARTGRNPQTGKKLKISARTVPKFKPGKTLKDAVAGEKKGILGIFKRK